VWQVWHTFFTDNSKPGKTLTGLNMSFYHTIKYRMDTNSIHEITTIELKESGESKDSNDSSLVISSLESSLEKDKKKKMRKGEMEFIETKLNKSLYVAWNRKYIGYLFWNNIGTPINLSITLLTALTASAPASSPFLSEYAITSIQLTVLIISAINTFFRPYVKASEHLKFILEIQKLGTQFDEIYYTPKSSFEEEEYILATQNYKKVLSAFNKYVSENSLEYKNICIDIIYYITINTILRKKDDDKEWVKINYV
jgi:hypothetical protein